MPRMYSAKRDERGYLKTRVLTNEESRKVKKLLEELIDRNKEMYKLLYDNICLPLKNSAGRIDSARRGFTSIEEAVRDNERALKHIMSLLKEGE